MAALPAMALAGTPAELRGVVLPATTVPMVVHGASSERKAARSVVLGPPLLLTAKQGLLHVGPRGSKKGEHLQPSPSTQENKKKQILGYI